MWLFTAPGSKQKIVHELNPLSRPNSAHSLWTIRILWILKTHYMKETYVQMLCRSINNSKVSLTCINSPNSMGRIQTAYFLCTHITLETSDIRVIWSFVCEGPVFFPEIQVCGFAWFSCLKRILQIYEKIVIVHHIWVQQIVHGPNPLNGPDSAHILWNLWMLINWIPKTHSMAETYVQMLCRSLTISKISPKCTKPPNSMGRIQTAYLLCIRITLETTDLRVICIDFVQLNKWFKRKAGGKPLTWLLPGGLVEW